jgi:hydroxylamine reductase
MFCYQCEQTARGTGCTTFGACGKDPSVAAMHDLLTCAAKRVASVAWPARQLGVAHEAADRFVVKALFTTVTNVNFDIERLAKLVRRGRELTDELSVLWEQAAKEQGVEADIPTLSAIPETTEDMVIRGLSLALDPREAAAGVDVMGLRDLVMYGLKGMAAYADHAQILGFDDQTVFDFFIETLAWLQASPTDIGELTARALEVGKVNVTVMALLDQANTTTYGHPVPTPVNIAPVKGKAILISGHDLKDLYSLLKQTEGTGINVYTHSEMLPAHGYPGLKKFPHLVGNYGGAWQDQRSEFVAFPGPILMTTNCIQKPKDDYEGRLFTTGLVAWPGIPHIEDDDYSTLIAAAHAAPGYEESGEEKTILVGFGHNAVLGLADKVVGAVKAGLVKHFFLIGGCDAKDSARTYYTDLAKAVPDDSVIMTLACGKFRFNKLDFGDIGGIPRLLDIGQCNDAYSAVVIAQALAEAFDTDINGLPLSMVLSWYEQKAVVILLSLLHLGVRDIKLGPNLPAFITPTVLQVLVDNFALAPITTVEADLADCLGLPTVEESPEAEVVELKSSRPRA